MFKDVNEHLQKDRASFEKMAEAAENEAAKVSPLQEYYKKSAGARLGEFIEKIESDTATKCYSTGFKKLDKELDGGLYAEGLYIIGAISSLGKTTFCLQIAEQIAAAGHDVLFFSLEQSEYELMAKSISRLSYELCTDERHAKTARGIARGQALHQYEIEEMQLIGKAYNKYIENTERRLYIFEGMGDIGVEAGAQQIRNIVANHAELTGNKPVVIIDYLQILAPKELKASDKQNTDISVNALKRLARDYKIPVLGISSFNRENYNAPVNMGAFKESGAIEYSSDVLIGLQAAGLEDATSDTNKAQNRKKIDETKKAEAREVELVILKNRNGRTGGKVQFKFRSMFNHFKEKDEAEAKPIRKY